MSNNYVTITKSVIYMEWKYKKEKEKRKEQKKMLKFSVAENFPKLMDGTKT
jgi:hypothetical protein